MKKNFRCIIVVILTISLLISSCGTMENTPQVSPNAASGNNAVEDEKNLTFDATDSSLDIDEKTMSVPSVIETDNNKEWLPQVEEVVSYCYYYLCYCMNEEQKKDYRKSLLDKGFEQIKVETVADRTYEYYEDNSKRILIVELEEVLLISITDLQEYMQKEEAAFTLDTVISMIEEEYNSCLNNENSLAFTQYPPEVFIKCWIPNLYEKTQIQAYQTLTKEGRDSGIYLIADDHALLINNDLQNICIADIDGNGISELLALYGFGSGIYRIHLDAYQYSNPIYFSGPKEIVHDCYSNCYVPKQGYGALAFRKISDAEVHLVEIEYQLNEDPTINANDVIYKKDYGKLVVKESQIDLEPEKLEDFPYYKWSDCFEANNEDSTNNEDKMEQLSEEVPKLTVNIGDTVVSNESWKEIWGEETEHQITFADMMKNTSDIPRFACPHGMGFQEEICLSFEDGVKPKTILFQDYLITVTGSQLYDRAGVIEREVRYGEDGNYYIGLMEHYALFLSSSTSSYTNPSYRGFRVICEFDEEHICEYTFVLSMEPSWETTN